MSAALSRLEFRLEDEVQGQPITPETVDLPTLRGFLAEVEALIKGDEAGASLTDSRVRIEEGSVKVVMSVAAQLATSLDQDLAQLTKTGDLDQVQPRRAEVLETWQRRARRNPLRRYLVQGDESPGRILTISSKTYLEHGGGNAWVKVEKYVTGKVIDMGGKQSPNVHVVMEGADQSLKVSASEAQLTGEPHLYQKVTLRITAEQHLETRQIRNAHLLEFLPVVQEADEGALARLWEKGQMAWQKVAGATDWVEELRSSGSN